MSWKASPWRVWNRVRKDSCRSTRSSKNRRDHFTAISCYQRALALAREIKDPVSIKKWTRNINLAYARIRLEVDQQNSFIV